MTESIFIEMCCMSIAIIGGLAGAWMLIDHLRPAPQLKNNYSAMTIIQPPDYELEDIEGF